jgi:RNA polymerase sigma-70 factor (ECF subfamily)
MSIPQAGPDRRPADSTALIEEQAAAIVPGAAATADDLRLVAALRAGDEAAFAALLDRYHPALLRLALLYVPSRPVAEDVVQETWVGVLQGIGRFEGRAALKTWIFRILINRAKTHGAREGRTIPFSALGNPAAEPGDPAVEPERFRPGDDPRWPHHWATPPQSWADTPEERLLAEETRRQIAAAIATLPPNQREVITLRDVEGWNAAEVCNILGVSETNQRVLLHRARAKVRHALDAYLNGEPAPA